MWCCCMDWWWLLIPFCDSFHIPIFVFTFFAHFSYSCFHQIEQKKGLKIYLYSSLEGCGVGRRIDDTSWFHFGALPKSQFLLHPFPHQDNIGLFNQNLEHKNLWNIQSQKGQNCFEKKEKNQNDFDLQEMLICKKILFENISCSRQRLTDEQIHPNIGISGNRNKLVREGVKKMTLLVVFYY